MSYRIKEIRTTLAQANYYPAGLSADLDAQLRDKMQSDIEWLLNEFERLLKDLPPDKE